MNACVYREVAGKKELVSIESVAEIKRDEKVVVGKFTFHPVRSGPYKSHTVEVATPVGKTTEVTATSGLCEVPADLVRQIQAKLRH